MFTVEIGRLNHVNFIYEQLVVQRKILFYSYDEFINSYNLFLSNPNNKVYVLIDDQTKKHAGCIVAQVNQELSKKSRLIEIKDFIILSKHRKNKGAEFLYEFFESEMKREQVYNIKVECEVNSTLNQNFYTSKGFKIYKKTYLKSC
jgi:hypothetical protein